jgi:uncharacterized membrane protein
VQLSEEESMERWNPLITFHALGATFAVVAGAILLLSPGKGGLAHRRLGLVWMGAMYWTALSSFGIRELRPGHLSLIHLLSLWTLVSLTIALWAAVTGRAKLHQRWVIGAYAGLAGAGIAAMAVPQRLAPQLMVHHPLTFTVAALGASAAAVMVAVVCRRRLLV